MLRRSLEEKLLYMSKKFPVITITGPRQSGKTTLVRKTFPDKDYVSLEDPDNRFFAANDPRGFLKTYEEAVIDEAQKVPELFSYIQTKVDMANRPGQYILTGSQNFLIFEKISQSLAGRVSVLKLLPLSFEEIRIAKSFDNFEQYLFHGFYPRIYDMEIHPEDFYPSYVQTYIERDVRMMKNITDLGRFQLFLKLCAGRIGQLLNLSSLANECGLSHTTIKSWITILEASYIVFLLKPHHKNFNKRLVKMPKLYFYDTGLGAFLLGIQSVEQLNTHYSKGALFESFIISEFIKKRFNSGREHHCYFWRDKNGHEIDCIIESGDKLIPLEIKSGRTITKEYFKGLDYWNRISSSLPSDGAVLYGGDKDQFRENGRVVSWRNVYKMNF